VPVFLVLTDTIPGRRNTGFGISRAYTLGREIIMRVLAKITVADVLMVIAILMILSAIILPHFAQSSIR
jgi:hypothetical protein